MNEWTAEQLIFEGLQPGEAHDIARKLARLAEAERILVDLVDISDAGVPPDPARARAKYVTDWERRNSIIMRAVEYLRTADNGAEPTEPVDLETLGPDAPAASESVTPGSGVAESYYDLGWDEGFEAGRTSVSAPACPFCGSLKHRALNRDGCPTLTV